MMLRYYAIILSKIKIGEISIRAKLAQQTH